MLMCASPRADSSEPVPAAAATDCLGHSRLDDTAATVTIKDSNGNTITLAKGGISIDSASKIALTAKTDITLSAQGKLTLSGKAGVSIAGATIAAKADSSFSAQGSAEAKLVSSGVVTVQGGLVKIN